MATFVSDTFTDTSGTALDAHTGETGATWTEHGSYTTGDSVISDANRQRANSTNATMYYASGAPAVAEYDVQADLKHVTSTGVNGVCGRVDTAANSMYQGIYNQLSGGGWELRKVVTGTVTVLTSSATSPPAAGSVQTILLEIRDATKKLFVDGVQKGSTSSDNVITAAGKAGIRCQNGSDTTGYHLDNFSATDAAATAPPRRTLMGVGR